VVLAAGSLVATLRRLPAGPWWPELDRLLDGVDRLEHVEHVLADRVVPAGDTLVVGPVTGLGEVGP
jgi:hypothetical protein